MFDIDAGKLLIIGLVALVVIGPKDLPRVMRQVGQMITRLRRMAGEFQGQFMEAIKEADLQDLRAEVAKLKDSATLDVNFDPVHDLRTELTKAVDSTPASTLVSDPAESLGPPEAPKVDGNRGGFAFPASSEIGPAPEAAAAGFAPTAEPAATGLVDAAPSASSAGGLAEQQEPSGSGRRKVVIPRRRPVSRFDVASGGAAPNRPRNILPPRRETIDR